MYEAVKIMNNDKLLDAVRREEQACMQLNACRRSHLLYLVILILIRLRAKEILICCLSC